MANFVLTYTPANSTAAVGIVIKKPSALVAPAQIWLEAVNHEGLAGFEETGAVYDGVHHEYYHEWTINGEPLPAWSKPQNLVTEHNNPNKRFGRQVGFLLPRAGSYVIDLVVRDRLGNVAMASTGTLAVYAPENFFPPQDRIYIDPDGDFSDVPAISARYRTLAELAVNIDSFNVNPTWLLLRRGKEHSLIGVNPLSNKNGRDKLYFGDTNNVCYVSAFGVGDRPVITPGTDVTRDNRNAMFEFIEPKNLEWRTFTGIAFEGGYDPENWIATASAASAISNLDYNHTGSLGFCLIHDIYTTGTGHGTFLNAYESNYSDGFHYMVTDSEFDGWQDYGHYGGAENHTLCFAGNYYHQKPATPTFGDKNGISNTHGPIRIPRGRYASVTMNDMFSRGGWDGNDQACLRLFPDSFPDQSGYVDRNTMTGGWEVIHMRRSSHGQSIPHNVVIERNLTIGTGRTARHIYTTRSGLTVRDNLMVDLNVTRSGIGWGDEAILLARDPNPSAVVAGNEADPIVIHGNTYLVMMDSTTDNTNKPFNLVTNSDEYFVNLVKENNVIHKPFGDITATEFAPIDVATMLGGINVEYLGIQKMFALLDFTLEEDVAPGDPLVIPYSDVTEDLVVGIGVREAGITTDQAYWQATEEIDTKHQLYTIRDQGADGIHNHVLFSERGHFKVTFGETNITFTNTSSLDWQTGQRMVIMLDRTSRKPAMETAYAISASVPAPRPQAGSAAVGGATSGRVSPRDFLLADRGETPSRGALEPAP